MPGGNVCAIGTDDSAEQPSKHRHCAWGFSPILDWRGSPAERFGEETASRTIEADYTTHGEIKEIVQEQISQNTSIPAIRAADHHDCAGGLCPNTRFRRAAEYGSNLVLHHGGDDRGRNFTETASRISTLNGETSQQFESVRSFIRLISSGIVIGKSTSAIKLKLENDVLYFFSGSEDSVTTDSAIAYFSSGKLYVNDVQVLSSLRIGGLRMGARERQPELQKDNGVMIWQTGRMSRSKMDTRLLTGPLSGTAASKISCWLEYKIHFAVCRQQTRLPSGSMCFSRHQGNTSQFDVYCNNVDSNSPRSDERIGRRKLRV